MEASNPEQEAPIQEKDPETEGEERQKLRELQEEARQRRMAYLQSVSPKLPQIVENAKRMYPRVESIHIAGQLYIYRGLKRSEYIQTMGAGLDKNKNDEKIASKCLIWPQVPETDWINMPAGIPMTLSDLILTASGFGAEDAIPVRL